MVDIQLLNVVLATKNYGLITNNDLDKTYFPGYENEFEFIKNHYETYHNVPDMATMVDNFPKFPVLEVAESTSYLVDKLQEEQLLRTTQKVLDKVADLSAQDSRLAVQYLIDQAPNLSKKIGGNTGVNLIADADLRLKEYVERTKNKNLSFVTTGFPQLDEILGGWNRKGEYAVIAGRTNMGKSWWVLYFSIIACMKAGLRVGFYSGEMPAEDVGFRFDTILSHISNFSLTRGNISVINDYENYINNLKNESSDKMFTVFTADDLRGKPTVGAIKNWCLRNKIDFLAIDQLSLLDDQRHGKGATECMTNISKDIKLMQTDLKIPILCASQLNREAAKETNGEIDTKNIADSDRVGRDATTIISINRKNRGDPLEVKVVKARDTYVGSKLLYNWDIDKGYFNYIPTETDAMKGEQAQEVRESFKDKSQEIF